MKRFNEFNQEVVSCRLCGEDTPMLGTKLCDGCWELETRIHRNPKLTEKILKALKEAEKEG